MFDELNTSFLGNTLDPSEDEGKETMIKVDHVSMIFNVANQKLNSLKEYFIAIARRELRFKEFRALDDISFEVKKGDVFGVLGTNGSGKSTTMKIVAGVLEPTKGTCEVHGKIAPLIELGAGFDKELTARENVYLNGALLGYSKEYIDDHMDEIIDFAEIEQFMDMPLKNYSSGMIARIAFAIATTVVPDILICDEVLSVGDFMFRQKCQRRINDLIENHGVTVLIVSHSNAQIENMCNKAMWIEKGHMRMIGSAKDVCSAYRVVGGREGSPESEKRLIQMMNYRRSEEINEYYSKPTGRDRYSTCVSVAKEYMEGKKAVVLAPSDNLPIIATASSLTSIVDGALFNCDSERLKNSTAGAIRSLEPDQVFIMGGTDILAPRIENDVEDETRVEPVRFDTSDPYEMSFRVYEYGMQGERKWGNSALVVYKDCDAGILTMLPRICSEKMPVFYVSPTDDDVNSKILDILSQGFERVIVVENGESLPEEFMNRISEMDLEVVRFSDDDPMILNKQIDDWMDMEDASEGKELPERLVVSTLDNPIDTYFIGPFAANKKAQVLLIAPSSLDETAKAFDFIDQRHGGIKQLYFLGGNSKISDDDKAAFTRTVLYVRDKYSGNLVKSDLLGEEDEAEVEENTEEGTEKAAEDEKAPVDKEVVA
ncbi:MAG: ATP-binding cassette domain-containing protein [Coriobacteriales bacterium]|jgi:ABC-2 type transport system ATP-binding protein